MDSGALPGQIRKIRHAESLFADVDEAVMVVPAEALVRQERILFVAPDGAHGRLAGTGGQRNVALLSVASARLGYAVASFTPAGENREFLRAAGVALYGPTSSIFVDRASLAQLHRETRRFAEAWGKWESEPANTELQAEAVAAYQAAAEHLVLTPPLDFAAAGLEEVLVSSRLEDPLSVVAYAVQLGAALADHRAGTCVVDLGRHALAAVLATANTPVRVVWYVQNVTQGSDSAILAQTTHVVACSDVSRVHKFCGIDVKYPHFVAPNGIALSRFVHGPSLDLGAREKLGLPKDAYVVGQVAAFGANKDQWTVAQAFAKLAHQEPSARLVYVGGGEQSQYAQRIAAFFRAEGLSERVSFLGDRDDVEALLPGLDVIVAASHEEGYGLTVAEAMAASRPLVLSAIAALEALAGAEALYFPVAEAEPLALHLLTLLRRETREAMGQRAYARLRAQGGDNATMVLRFLQAIEAIAQQ